MITDREIEDALEALARLEREAIAFHAGDTLAATAARGAARADADEVRDALRRAREEGPT